MGSALRTLLSANANGRERCPSKGAFLSTTDFASILVASGRCCGYGSFNPTEPEGNQEFTSHSICGLRSEALTCRAPEASRCLAKGLVVRPNVRAEAGPTAKCQARAVENAPARRAGLVF